MDKETLKADNARIKEALKTLNRALAKEDKAKDVLKRASNEVKLAKENYATALEEAKRTVGIVSHLPQQ